MDIFGHEQLRNQELASYDWGRYWIRLSRLSAYREKRYLVEILAGMASDICICKTPNEFRSFVALNHEVAHYQQDLLTGVGHWDYVRRKEFRDEMLSDFRLSTWMHGDTESVRSQSRQKLVDFANNSLFNFYGLRSEDALGLIRSQVEGYESHDDAEEIEFTLPRILEMDAVLNTWVSMSDLKFSKEGARIAEDHKEIYDPYSMPAEYGDTLKKCLYALVRFFHEPNTELDWEMISFSKQLLQIFLDIALAHPPPSYFASGKIARMNFEPGIRLLRMLRTFQEKAPDFFPHAEMNFPPSSPTDKTLYEIVDSVSRKTLEFTYPSAKQVYADWVDYIRSIKDDDPILDWREEICTERASNPHNCSDRTLGSFIQNNIPLFVDLPTSADDYLYLTNRLFGDSGRDLYWTLKANERDLSLIDLYLGTGRGCYICPLAAKKPGETATCEAQVTECSSGLTDIQNLPMSPGCTIRTSLRDVGFNL